MRRRPVIVAVACAATLIVAGAIYWEWKGQELSRFLNQYMPNTRAHGAADAILGSLGVKKYEKTTGFERTRSPTWQSLGIHKATVLSLDNRLTAKLTEWGIDSSQLGQAKVSAGVQSGQEAQIAVLQVADLSALASEIQALAGKDNLLAKELASPDARVVTAVGVVVSQKTLQSIVVAASAASRTPGGSATAGSASGKLNGQISSTFGISPGTVLFYRISRLCWDKERDLVRLPADAKGTDTCPNGLSPSRPTN